MDVKGPRGLQAARLTCKQAHTGIQRGASFNFEIGTAGLLVAVDGVRGSREEGPGRMEIFI